MEQHKKSRDFSVSWAVGAISSLFVLQANAEELKDVQTPVVVLIDPGHGGKDTGTMGPKGESEQNQDHFESHIVLAIAKIVGERLVEENKKGSVHIIPKFTREDDVLLPLEERLQLVKDLGADMFVSIHVDYASMPGMPVMHGIHGLTSYIRRPNECSVRHEWISAANGLPFDRHSCTTALAGFRQQMAVTEAMQLVMLSQLGKELTLGYEPQRESNFVVVLNPEVPSTLIEVGNAANPSDFAMMTSSAGQKKIGTAIADSIISWVWQRPLLSLHPELASALLTQRQPIKPVTPHVMTARSGPHKTHPKHAKKVAAADGELLGLS